MAIEGPTTKVFSELGQHLTQQLQEVVRNTLAAQLVEARQKIEKEFEEREQQLLKKEEELKERLAHSSKTASLTLDNVDAADEPSTSNGSLKKPALKKKASFKDSVVPEAKEAWAPEPNATGGNVRFSADDDEAEVSKIKSSETDPDDLDGSKSVNSSHGKRSSRFSWNSFSDKSTSSGLRPSLFGGQQPAPRGRTTKRVSAIARNRETTATKDLKFNAKTREKVFEDKPQSKGNQRVAAFLQNTYFDFAITLIIIANSVLIGAQSDYAAEWGREAEMPKEYQNLDLFFCVVFTAELALRIVGEGSNFLARHNRKMHLLDTLIVVSALIEQFLIAAGLTGGAGENLAIFSMLRILRLVRVARSVRLMQFSRDLRALVHGMMYCVKPLVWAVVLLTLIMFMFSVVIMEFAVDEFTPKEWLYSTTGEPEILGNCSQGVLQEAAQRNLQERKVIAGDTMPHAGEPNELRWYFGHLPRTMYTLFKSISGGETWGIVAEPLKNVSWALCLFFCVYVGVVVFAVLNIVTSIFIENARKNALHDKDNLIWEEVQERNWQGESLKAMFQKADLDGSGTVDWLEFKIHFEDPIVQAYLRTLGLDVQAIGVASFFDLLDFDETRRIDLSTFMAGCLHFRGAARSIDVERLSHKVRDLEQNILEAMVNLARAVGSIDPQSIVKSTVQGNNALRPSWMRSASQLPGVQE